MMGHFLAVTKIPIVTAEWVAGLSLNRYLIIALVLLVYQVGGPFIDDFAFMMLATPIFYPVIMKLGFDPIWFGIIIMVNLMVGGIIPPVAMQVFIVKNITKVPFGVIYSGCYPFLIALVSAVVLLCVFPQLVLFLPSLLMK